MNALGTLLLAFAPQAQSPDAPRAIELGAALEGRLDAASPSGDGVVLQRFELVLATAAHFTLVLRSLDFVPSLGFRVQSGHAHVLGSSRSACEALVVAEGLAGSAFTIEVGSWDARSGAYTLSAREGEAANPAGGSQEQLRAEVEACEAVAAHALEMGERERALRYWLQAGALAYESNLCVLARSPLARCIESDCAPEFKDLVLQARLLLGLCDVSERNLAGALARLQPLQPELEQNAQRAAPNSEAQFGAVSQLGQLYEGLADALQSAGVARSALDYYQLFVDTARIIDRLGAAFPDYHQNPNLELLAWSKLARALDAFGQSCEAGEALDNCERAAAEVAENPSAGAEAKLSRARIEAAQGASSAAREHALEALALQARDRDACPDLKAQILGTLAAAEIDLRCYEQAGAHLEEVAVLVQEHCLLRLQVPLHRARAVLDYHLGDCEQARAEIETAIGCADLENSAEGTIESWIDLALVLDDQGESLDAEHWLDQAITGARGIGSARLESIARIDRAALFDERGDFASAALDYGLAAELSTRSGDGPQAALARSGVGWAACRAGELAQACAEATSALRELEAFGQDEAVLDARCILATVALRRGDPSELQSQIDRARESFDHSYPRSLDPFQRSSHRARYAQFGALEQSLVGLELAQARAGGDPEQPLLLAGLRSASRWKGRVLLEELARAQPPGAIDADLCFAARAAWLPGNAALLEYAESVDRLLVYVVCGDRLECFDLGELARLSKESETFSEEIADRYADSRALAKSAHGLWSELLGPVVAGLPGEIETLVIVPSPALAALPFEALVSDLQPGTRTIAREPRCVIDDFLVCYAPATTLLPLLAERPAREGPECCLLLGGATYGSEPGPLPESRDEVISVALRLLPDLPIQQAGEALKRIMQTGKNEDLLLSEPAFDLFVGQYASAEVLRRDLRKYSDLHLAAHTRIDTRDPRRSALLLSATPTEPGLFTLEDAWNAKLDANLVILSACDSARGPVQAGEGVQSLAYAFLHSGARAVAATLWPVKDDQARDIVKKFEVSRRETNPLHAARALRAARQEFREGNERGKNAASAPAWCWEPWKWAAWVYIGAPPR